MLNRRVDHYLEAATSSGDRSRIVVVMISIASLLVFSVMWNSRDESWLRQRSERARDALQWFVPIVTGVAPVGVGQERYERARDWLLLRTDAWGPGGALAENEHARVDLEAHVALLERLLYENVVSIQVPVIGVSFDINDLGVLSGVTFLIMLVWLRFCIAREQENLEILFKEAAVAGDRNDVLGDVYHALAVRQVAVTPRIPGFRNERTWDCIPYILLALPLILHLWVVGNDWRTVASGRGLSRASTEAAMIFGTVLLVVIAIVTVQCFLKHRAMARTWQRVYERIAGPAGSLQNGAQSDFPND